MGNALGRQQETEQLAAYNSLWRSRLCGQVDRINGRFGQSPGVRERVCWKVDVVCSHDGRSKDLA